MSRNLGNKRTRKKSEKNKGDKLTYKIYTGKNCINCKRLKEQLKDFVNVEYANVDDPTILADAMIDDVTTLPSLVLNGIVISDMKEIVKIVKENL